MPLADLTFNELLAQTAARTPAPGGGAAAALAGAMAAALSQMVAAFAPEPDPEAGARAGALRTRLLELADDDLVAYQPVLEALRNDRSKLAAALSAAAEPPLEIATAAAEVAELAAGVADAGTHLLGDACAALVLAQAATRAAARLVEINLAGAPDDSRHQQVRELVERSERARIALPN